MGVDDHIEIRPGVRSGKPCFKGTRMTVCDVHLHAALMFAAARERRLAGLLAG